MRRTLHLSIGLLTLALSAVAAAQKPNILVFLVDDLGTYDVGCYGSSFYETPAIDALAAQGQRYTQAYSAHPRCVPSRYGFFTGRFPARDGCPGNTYNVAPEELTLAEALKAGGYRTFYTGKWHLAKTPEEMPEAQGFDINIGGGHAGAPSSYFAPYNNSKDPHHHGGNLPGLEDAPEGEFLTDRLTDETIQFLKNHVAEDPDQPFFAVLAHYAVHTPIEAKEDYTAYFTSKLGKRGKEAFIQRDGTTKTQQDNAIYAAMIRSTDESMERVMQTLKTLNIADNTLILFTSDHGGLSNRGASNKRKLPTSNLPLRAGKGHLYEGGTRVPFIINWPGVTTPGSQSDALVTGTDVYATLLEAAELPAEPEHAIDSVSILPAIKGESFERSPIVWHSPRPRPESTGDRAASALRDGDYKLLKFYYPEVHYELYNVTTDPGENQDLSKSQPERCKQLAALLNAKLTELAAIDTWPTKKRPAK
ncbi:MULTISPECIES: sulfatase [unclassified Lentimonas]|uniref:sulfatase n=1 Tax=unclassified Lentimonas TaxID=2630993 RepID=UPI00132A6BDA|nr:MULTISPECIES: sulfatase [unclassified Lentimonas]CAA6677020.1 Choline-sulfatase (EC [Lentimonas sp. CC4]CAA6686826.1 Choline-sulfatase (EC [Lentimonas sp. CC6]CAA7075596.1 Choline-sulfatase (EC [Lentimonas sp. CC4]CAA7168247.1 Choline-sulfatase (EC [Lentimonas sp. CC21]CAA7181602.1 Choline-sulfatase (EC [Lentimonas sp. CC8]